MSRSSNRTRFAIASFVAVLIAGAIGIVSLHQSHQSLNSGMVVAGDPPDHNGQGGSGDGSTKGTGQGNNGGGTGGGGHG